MFCFKKKKRVNLARFINEQIRKYDYIVRWGGEEFIKSTALKPSLL